MNIVKRKSFNKLNTDIKKETVVIKLQNQGLADYFRYICICFLFLFVDLPPIYATILQIEDSLFEIEGRGMKDYREMLSPEDPEMFEEPGSYRKNHPAGNAGVDENSKEEELTSKTSVSQKSATEVNLPPQPTIMQMRQAILYLLILFSFILLFVLFFFWWKMRKAKNQNAQLNKRFIILQKDYMYLKSQYQRQVLKYRSKEVSTKVECLLEKNNYFVSVIKQISELKKGNDESIGETIKQLKEKNEEKIWEEFKALVQESHPNFYINLYKAHPNLSKNEEKMCIFICLNMSTKDISSVTSQQIKTIEIARSRLRTKLVLNRDENLTSYLQQF